MVIAFAPLRASAEEIESILVHPLFGEPHACMEHWDGQFQELGDALGTDCSIQKLEDRNGRTWVRSYSGDGLKNEEWFGWQKNVLSPIEGKVMRISVNPTVSEPGILGKGMATFVVIKSDDSTIVMVAHVDQVGVKVGDEVKAGQVIAKVGNNGQARNPHVHIGAARNGKPLQIRFDQKKMRGSI